MLAAVAAAKLEEIGAHLDAVETTDDPDQAVLPATKLMHAVTGIGTLMAGVGNLLTALKLKDDANKRLWIGRLRAEVGKLLGGAEASMTVPTLGYGDGPPAARSTTGGYGAAPPAARSTTGGYGAAPPASGEYSVAPVAPASHDGVTVSGSEYAITPDNFVPASAGEVFIANEYDQVPKEMRRKGSSGVIIPALPPEGPPPGSA